MTTTKAFIRDAIISTMNGRTKDKFNFRAVTLEIGVGDEALALIQERNKKGDLRRQFLVTVTEI